MLLELPTKQVQDILQAPAHEPICRCREDQRLRNQEEGWDRCPAPGCAKEPEVSRLRMMLAPEGHSSSDDEDIKMEASREEQEQPSSSGAAPADRQSKEVHKRNDAVELQRTADMADGGELHVGSIDLRVNPNKTMKEYLSALGQCGGSTLSVVHNLARRATNLRTVMSA